MWSYSQHDGSLFHDYVYVVTGYSGADAGKNTPAAENVHDVGPIPRGRWVIGTLFDSDTHGPDVMHLVPEPATETYSRSGFLIHGDKIGEPGVASHGCIILPRAVRKQIAASNDHTLEVVV
jgi:fermentation-respiration switch protein FrsA (DUF1100 family)